MKRLIDGTKKRAKPFAILEAEIFPRCQCCKAIRPLRNALGGRYCQICIDWNNAQMAEDVLDEA